MILFEHPTGFGNEASSAWNYRMIVLQPNPQQAIQRQNQPFSARSSSQTTINTMPDTSMEQELHPLEPAILFT